MATSSRNEVQWLGNGPIQYVEAACSVLGLSVRYVTSSNVRPSDQPQLRAVLVPVDGLSLPRAHRTLTELLSTNLLDYGVLLAIVTSKSEESYQLRSGVMKVTQLREDGLPLIEGSTPEIAKLLRAHDPGPAVDTLMSVEVVGESDLLMSDDEILLRRAFHGFTKITLSNEHGGRSTGCRVWRVVVEGGLANREAFIAKTAPFVAVQAERENYRTYVHDQIPFPFRAPIVDERCVSGRERDVLVSMFVGRAQRVDRYLACGGSPHGVITSLFTDALGSWRAHPEATRASIGRILVERQENSVSDPSALQMSLLPNPDDLLTTYRECKKTDSAAPTPKQIMGRLKKLPELEFHYCHAHGDLNIRNVFVRWHSTDAIVIDFEKSGQQDPMARDLSKLETSIAFTGEDANGSLLGLDELDRLFKHPILPPNRLRAFDDPRKAAIRQIRRHACGEGISNAEFEIFTICHFLRFAVAPKTPSDQSRRFDAHRPKCYKLAYMMLDDLEASY